MEPPTPPVHLEYASTRLRLATQSRWGKVSLGCALTGLSLLIFLTLLIHTFGKPGHAGSPPAYKVVVLGLFILPMILAFVGGMVTGLVGSFQRSHLRSLAVWAFFLNFILAWALANMA